MGFTAKELFGENFEHLERHVEPYRGVDEYRAVEETVYDPERVRKWKTRFDSVTKSVEELAEYIFFHNNLEYQQGLYELERWLEERRGYGIPTMVVDDILAQMDKLNEWYERSRSIQIRIITNMLNARRDE